MFLIQKRLIIKMSFLFRRISCHFYKGNLAWRSCSSNIDAPDFNMENPFEKEKQQCVLCKHKIQVDYKNVKLLSQFQSPYTGRIYGKHITGLCSKQQELVEKEIVKAQSAGLMGTYVKDPRFFEDPELFNVEKPIRPHRF